ncbi:hypothetical protein [Citrobacter freundii complex sp. CFNIH2]|uniref:hypothetical protein n=1 Tax=Citrobacter freundii complex sp. CFNIH2 TaxID=2066049 RepID=UPI001651CF95|nr:hypothetical protein [Citrobacter freundii complex sp. CFNIH2]
MTCIISPGGKLLTFDENFPVKRLPIHFAVLCYHIATLIMNSSNYFALLIISRVDVLNLNAIEKDSVSLDSGINLPAGIVI